ncbi:MAG TPA: hypothetical protein VMD55_12050 [Terracidiphilus sp.]|nr:hypothetical protein [Terracidiphilus sp.]
MQVQISEFLFDGCRPSFASFQHLIAEPFLGVFLAFATGPVRTEAWEGCERIRTKAMKSIDSDEKTAEGDGPSGWLRFALLTAATAVAGGLATAWFYRKTLLRLRETGETSKNPHFGISDEAQADRPSDEM